MVTVMHFPPWGNAFVYQLRGIEAAERFQVVKMVMETVQIRLTEKQIRNIDVLVKKGVYPNRSEAVRDAVRKLVENGQ
jgi:hypothetical protein